MFYYYISFLFQFCFFPSYIIIKTSIFPSVIVYVIKLLFSSYLSKFVNSYFQPFAAVTTFESTFVPFFNRFTVILSGLVLSLFS